MLSGFGTWTKVSRKDVSGTTRRVARSSRNLNTDETRAAGDKLRLWLRSGVPIHKTGITREFINYSEIPLQPLASQEM